MEGYAAAMLTVAVFTLPVTPGNQRQAMIILCMLIGLGIGFGVGGVRFGGSGARFSAWLAIITLSILVAAMLAKRIYDGFD